MVTDTDHRHLARIDHVDAHLGHPIAGRHQTPFDGSGADGDQIGKPIAVRSRTSRTPASITTPPATAGQGAGRQQIAEAALVTGEPGVVHQ